MNRALRWLCAGIAVIACSGCARLALGVANAGVTRADASATYDSAHGLRVDIYQPRASAQSPSPVIVFFYGGGWTSGRRSDYRFVGRRLADAGIVAMVPDYRLYPATTFPGFVEDGASAVAWARRHARDYGGDPARVHVAGHSAGAQIAALLGTDARYLGAHGMRPRDLAGVVGLSGPYDFHIDAELAPIFGTPAQWPAAQAVGFVDGDEPPFLLIHGSADARVEPRNSEALAKRLGEQGEPAEVLMLAGARHTAPLQALYAPGREPRVLASIRAFVGLPSR